MTSMQREQFRAALRSEVDRLATLDNATGVSSPGRFGAEIPLGKRRRRGRPDPAGLRGLTLTADEDGVLSWEDGFVLAAAESTLRRGRRAVRRAEVLEQLQIEPLEPSLVGQRLERADRDLTPDQGLLSWDGQQLTPLDANQPVTAGRVLLFIHGTFSQAKPIFDQIAGHEAGQEFLLRAGKHYDRILAFNHPTLSVSPVLNALDLSRRLSAVPEIDVIAHSRGGLVTRWWLESFDRSPATVRRRAVLVGAPLGGTSLASPPHLRRLLSWASNLAAYVQPAATASALLIPWTKVIAHLAQLTAVVMNVGANTPLVDAAVALVPGLAAMSRILNNAELLRLRTAPLIPPQYFVVRASYRPLELSWKFWKAFVGPKERALHALFPGPNDTVVDYPAMAELPPALAATALEFPEGPTVHHTNYFEQPELARKLTDWLLPAISMPGNSPSPGGSPPVRRGGRAHS